MVSPAVSTLAQEAREYIAEEITPLFSEEPQLAVPTKQYEFRVKFPGKQEVPNLELMEKVAEQIKKDKLSLYAHIPRCNYRCNFCTYAVTVSGNPNEDADRLLREKETLEKILRFDNVAISSLYFGGGTPTTITSEAISRLVGGFVNSLPLTLNAEITMEGSPETITKEKIEAAQKAGVNRFSVGVQTFDEKILNECNRQHTATQAEKAIQLLCESGFPKVNVDLMRGLPHQTVEGFINDLLHVIDYQPETIHVYRMRVQRTGELHTIFEHNLEKLALPSLKEICAMQYLAHKVLTENGYQREHTASWTKIGTTMYKDRWQQQIPLLAFGWKAYSLFQFGEWHNCEQLGEWRARVDKKETAIEKAWKYDEQEKALRQVLFRLKMASGVPEQQIESLSELPYSRFMRVYGLGIVENRDNSFVFSDKGIIIGEEAIKYLSLE